MEGTVGIDDGKSSHRYRLGDVYVASYPRTDFTCHTHNARSHTLELPQSLLTEVASFTSDPPGDPWDFLPFAPVTGGARQWRNITRYIDGLLADPAAVAVFPNTLVTEPPARDRRDAQSTSFVF